MREKKGKWHSAAGGMACGLIGPTTEKASWFTISSAENDGWNFQMPPWLRWCPVSAWARRQACVPAFVWFAELDRELAAFEHAREDWSLELLPSCSSAGPDQKLSEKGERQGPQVNDKNVFIMSVMLSSIYTRWLASCCFNVDVSALYISWFSLSSCHLTW